MTGKKEEKEEKVAKTEEETAGGGKETKKRSKPKVQAKKETTPLKKTEEIIKSIESLNVLELVDLVKALEEKFGVSATMPIASAASQLAPQAGAAAEEKTAFNVILKEIGAQKIQVIKTVRSLTDLGLKEAKALVDGAPKPVKSGVTKEEAEEMKKKLEEVGAKVALE